jgi:outer membrane protein assembly factor BamB
MSQDNQIFSLKVSRRLDQLVERRRAGNRRVCSVPPLPISQGTVVAGFSSGELNAYRYENGRQVWQDALARTSITTSVASLATSMPMR